MREGHMDASGFLYASADVFCYSLFSLSGRVMFRIFGCDFVVDELSTVFWNSRDFDLK